LSEACFGGGDPVAHALGRVRLRNAPFKLGCNQPRQGRRGADSMKSTFSYDQAFTRNLGLVSPREQERLRRTCVALPGLGGVGGAHLQALARMGIGAFHLADPDTFEVANFNRQLGASMATVGRSKAEVMAETVSQINP